MEFSTSTTVVAASLKPTSLPPKFPTQKSTPPQIEAHTKPVEPSSPESVTSAKHKSSRPSSSNLEEVQKYDDDLIRRIASVTKQSRSDEHLQLMDDWKKLQTEYSQAREAFAGEKSRFQVELQHAQQQASDQEQMNIDLMDDLNRLESEKVKLAGTVETLESALQHAKQQIVEEKAAVTKLKEADESTYQHDLATLEEENHSLRTDIEQHEQNRHQLHATIEALEANIRRLEKVVVPDLEASLECEKDKSALLETKLENMQMELEDTATAIGSIKLELDESKQLCVNLEMQLQDEIQKNESNVSELHLEIKCKTDEIGFLQTNLENLRVEMESSDTEKIAREREIELIEAKLKETNDALESTMEQLENADKENEQLRRKLADTIASNQQFQNSLGTHEVETNKIINDLNELLTSERQEREKAQIEYQRAEAGLRQALQERDDARSNMQGFDERENELYRKLQQGDLIRREMHNKLMQLMGNIRVVVRVRPVLLNESTGGACPFSFPTACDNLGSTTQTLSSSDITKNMIEVQEPPKDRGGLKDRRKTWRFGFDQVFRPDSTQNDVWESVEPLVQSVVDGFNVTLFAYGQTGSGVSLKLLLLGMYLTKYTENIHHAGWGWRPWYCRSIGRHDVPEESRIRNYVSWFDDD